MSTIVEYITVDSSVFISAFGQSDKFTKQSRRFLKETTKNPDTRFVLPSIIVAEVIVDLRKQKRVNLKEILMSLLKYKLVSLDSKFLEQFYPLTKNPNLKTSDLIIAATAKMHNAILISWDKRHLSSENKICKTITPSKYLKSL